MITSITADNVVAYKALYDSAVAILSGYKSVRTYDKEKTYYYKDIEATEEDKLFMPVEGIDGLENFAKKLALYGNLYIKVGEKVEKFHPLLGITSLEEYFSWLKTLGMIDRKYTILPLDEPHFEINANTRAINVPASFKKNGIAVQGDDLAEVLYFKVDRYFDYMDLNNCDIFIQWETPKDANGNTVKSASPAYIRDIESEPGKLIFGWILDDSITANAGNLKFSVRFYQWNNKEDAKSGTERILAYSFSTLTASVAIQPNIGFNPEKDEYITEDLGLILLDRLKDGVVVGGYAAAKPVFITNLSTDEYDWDVDGTVLNVLAYAPDTGSISYTWKKQGLNDGNTVEGETITQLVNKNIFIPIPDKTKLDPKISYWIEAGEAGHVLLGNRELTAEELKDDDFYVYERHASYEVDLPVEDPENRGVTGVYWAVAENRLTNSSTTAESIRAVFPRPKDIVITTNPATSAILTGAEGSEACTLSVEVEDMTQEPSNPQKKTYQWSYCNDSSLNFRDTADSTDFIDLENETNNQLTATEEGHYKVVIYNTRNGVTKSKSPEIITRVTKAAKDPEIKPLSAAEKKFALSSLSENNCPTIELNDENVASDYYIVKWYYTETGEHWKEDVKIFEQEIDGLIAKFNPRDYAEIIREVATDKDLDGDYYPIVINHLNGSEAQTRKPTVASDFFTITN